ncbi:MAG: hypothetical protein RJA70_3725 [Pseudomonadota bacterium]
MSEQEPKDWDELFDHFSLAESRRTAELQRQAHEADALREFEAWCQIAIERLMQDIKRVALARSAVFVEKTGRELLVQYPSGPPISTSRGGPEIRFLKLGIAGAQVHVYSSHARGGLTHIHLLPSRSTSLRENDRLVSEPGAFIVRRPDDDYELRFLRGDPEGPAGTPMSIDVLIFRAFRLLFRWAEEA